MITAEQRNYVVSTGRDLGAYAHSRYPTLNDFRVTTVCQLTSSRMEILYGAGEVFDRALLQGWKSE